MIHVMLTTGEKFTVDETAVDDAAGLVNALRDSSSDWEWIKVKSLGKLYHYVRASAVVRVWDTR